MAFCPANQQSWFCTPQLSMMQCVSATIGNTTPTKSLCQQWLCNTDHAHTWPASVSHNQLRNLIANLLTKVCHNVCIEPPLQFLTGDLISHARDGARLGVSTQGLWGDHHSFVMYRFSTPILLSYHKLSNTTNTTASMNFKNRVPMTLFVLLHSTCLSYIRRDGEAATVTYK